MADKISLINDDEVELHYNLEEDIINDESIKEDALLVDEDCSTTDKPIVNTTTRAKVNSLLTVRLRTLYSA